MKLNKSFFALLILFGAIAISAVLYEHPQSYFYKYSLLLRKELPKFCELMETQIPKLESTDENTLRQARLETWETIHKEFSEHFRLAFVAISNAEIKTQFNLYNSLAKEAHLDRFDCPKFENYLRRQSQVIK